MRIRPAASGVGADLLDVDVRSISDDDVHALDRAWAEHGVLFVRGQRLDPDEQLAFATRFADVDVNQFIASVDGHPEVAQVLKEADQTLNIGGGWHADHSFDVVPARGSVLYAVETPPEGGDTLFADTGAAYDALSDGFKKMLGTLRAVHTNDDVYGADSPYSQILGDRLTDNHRTATTVHPVVIAHPETGRPSLFVNPGFTRRFEGWSQSESAPLLQQLYEHVAQPQFTTRFSWEPGSIAMWDNRSMWHLAVNDYDGHRRLMHRVTIKGSALTAAS